MASARLFRLSYLAPIAYVHALRARGGQRALESDVAARVLRAGGAPVRLVMQDPTDETRLSVLAESRPVRADDVLSLAKAEEVEPPAVSSWTDPEASHWLARLDPGLTPDEAVAIGRALEGEWCSRHLGGFASTLDPDFPVAASWLAARGALLAGDPLPKPGPAFGATEVRRMAIGATLQAERAGIPPDLALREVRRAALRHATEADLGPQTPGYGSEIDRLGAACVRIGAFGAPVVDPGLIAIAAPPGEDPGRVPHGALWLAAAETYPGASLARDHRRSWELPAELLRPTRDPALRIARLRAAAALERARKTIERGRWVRWYNQAR